MLAVRPAPTSSRLVVVVALVALVVAALGGAAPSLAHAQSTADLRHPDPARRIAAAGAAGERRDRSAVSALIELLRDRDARVRLAAVLALHQIRDKRGVRHLMVAAQTDFDPRVRAAAARAVRRMAPASFAAKLATADKPPVRRGPPPAPPGALRRQTFSTPLSAGVAVNALRAVESIGGIVGLGLRWPRAEFQLGVLFPAIGMNWQLRLNLLTAGRVIPYLTGGVALIFGYDADDQPNGPAASLFVGAGLRVRPSSRLFLFAEVVASFTVSQMPRPATPGLADDDRVFALPVLAGIGVELWP